MKIRPVGAQLFLADGRKDGHKDSNSCSSQFCTLAYDRSFVLKAKFHNRLWHLRNGRRKVIRKAVFSVEGKCRLYIKFHTGVQLLQAWLLYRLFTGLME